MQHSFEPLRQNNVGDLVGSTALSARMDPEDLREVISAYQKCVAETVGRFGGFVAKFMGDGVLIADPTTSVFKISRSSVPWNSSPWSGRFRLGIRPEHTPWIIDGRTPPVRCFSSVGFFTRTARLGSVRALL